MIQIRVVLDSRSDDSDGPPFISSSNRDAEGQGAGDRRVVAGVTLCIHMPGICNYGRRIGD